MSAPDWLQLSTALHRLEELTFWLNPFTAIPRAIALIHQVIDECQEEPPGNPDGLDEVGRAYAVAGAAIGEIVEDVWAIRSDGVPDVWRGLAGASASNAVGETAIAIDSVPPVFRDVRKALAALAGGLREAKEKHRLGRSDLHLAREQFRRGPLLAFPPGTALDLAIRGVRRCLEAYQQADSAYRAAAEQFRDAAGDARVGAAEPGGRLSALDAVVLASQASGFGSLTDAGLLTPFQLDRASDRLNELTPDEYRQMADLLGRAKSDAERAYLLKALAAGHSMTELDQFAGLIRGRSMEWLRGHLMLVPPGHDQKELVYRDSSGKAAKIEQLDGTTCGAMVILVTRSMADPIYTLGLTTGGHPDDPAASSAAAFEQRLAAEQRRLHDQATDDELGPFDYPQRFGIPPWGAADALNEYSAATGVHYRSVWIDDTDPNSLATARSQVMAAVDRGVPVPILLGGVVPDHYEIVIGHHGDQVQLFLPSSGATFTVSEDALFGGDDKARNAAVGHPHLQGVLPPW